MKKRKYTITDIAQDLGISVATVSFIANGKAKEKRISASQARRVSDYMKKVGYRQGDTDKQKASNTIVVVLLTLADVIKYEKLIRILEKEFTKRNYQLKLSVGVTGLVPDNILKQKYRGYILLHPDQETESQITKVTSGMVSFGVGKDVDLVMKAGAYTGTKDLLERSDNVGLLLSLTDNKDIKQIQSGYLQAIDEMERDTLVKKIAADKTEEEEQSEIENFVRGNELDAVLVSSSRLVRHCIGLRGKSAEFRKLEIYSLEEEDELLGYLDPPVRSVLYDWEDIARQLSDALEAKVK